MAVEEKKIEAKIRQKREFEEFIKVFVTYIYLNFK